MNLTSRNEWIQLGLIAAMFAAAAICWPYAPERMPVHWNLQGEVDGYGGKFVGLLLLPLVTAGLYLLLLVLPWVDPGRLNYRSFAGTYQWIRLTLVLFQAGLYVVVLLAAFDQPVDVASLVALGVGALLVVLGNAMGKIRPNWFVGVRTPWTLSSKRSWDKTHRLAGWIFIGLGPLVALTGILRSEWLFVATLVVGGTSLAWLVVYSYLVYRGDPHRISPAGTSPEAE
ncbi:MAG: DUF1648 domain-containing protein [Planctomycetota bacterium]|nr:MAG: DUF1648 domain-containing protein [Planctomycetota bacterium]